MLDLSTVSAISLKTTLLIIAVGLMSVVMARKSAAYRHFLWTSALTLSLLMPFAILYLPSYDLIPLPWQAAKRLVQFSAHAQAETVWPAISIIWFSGALTLLIRNAVAHAGLIRWIRRARPLGAGRWAATLYRVSNELGFTGSLHVLESARVVGPCTWGLVQPVLLLPSSGGDWPESQRRHALLHSSLTSAASTTSAISCRASPARCTGTTR
jgi:beta-lactamase regulating signal transducer with metallopeptidase domain